MCKTGLTKVEIISSEEVSEDVYLVSFKRTFDFIPGQVLGIATEADGPRRLYSICSGKEDAQIKILYNVVKDGYLTPQLSELTSGDSIWITGPRGKFTDNNSPAYWIATGTGIAPFYSMHASGLSGNKILIHGERFLERFWFYDEFQRSFGNAYIRCCSQESNEAVYSGRVTDYLRSASFLPEDYKYYLCGRAEMVVEARDILIARGIPFNKIISEIYF